MPLAGGTAVWVKSPRWRLIRKLARPSRRLPSTSSPALGLFLQFDFTFRPVAEPSVVLIFRRVWRRHYRARGFTVRQEVALIRTHVFENGFVLVAEEMCHLESAGFTFLLPAGSIHDPPGKQGLAALTCEMSLRGSGSRDSRQFCDDLENLGIDSGESVSNTHTSFSGSSLAENLHAGLEIYADLIRQPHLPPELLEAGRQTLLQEILSIEDEPSQKLMQELKKQHLRPPYGFPSQGTEPTVEAITHDDIVRFWQTQYVPGGGVLAVAGRFDWDALLDHVQKLFADWPAQHMIEVSPGGRGQRFLHLPYESNQTHIGIAYESVPYNHPEYFHASAGVGALSSGSSARLFTEVREKRGLCYTVYASYYSTRLEGAVLCYAGTSADRAQATLDVTLEELLRLPQGIEEFELQRLKARVKSALMMQQESSMSRTMALVRDWYHLGRARTRDELGAQIDALTRDSINHYLADHPPQDLTIVTLGSKPLEYAPR